MTAQIIQFPQRCHEPEPEPPVVASEPDWHPWLWVVIGALLALLL